MLKVTDETFHDEVFHHDGPVAVLFGTEYCNPCKKVAKVLEQLSTQDGTKVVKVNIEEDSEVATYFNITTIPTTIIFARGAPRISYAGVNDLAGFRKMLDEAIADGEREPAVHAH